MDLNGQTLLGKYKLEGRLGEGGMCVVWRGVHIGTSRDVAVKVLDDRFLNNKRIVERFGREARAASAIHHPGIVEVLDIDRTEDGVPFLVMEHLEGETLADRIERKGQLPQKDAMVLMKQLLDALDAAHAHGVVHRDLKPDNVFLVPTGRRREIVKILDFGISQKTDEAVTNLTLAGSVLGTPHYMAPEQARGESDLDARCDVYAAGIVLYECVAGDVPFDSANYNRLMQMILNDEPVPPSRHGASISSEFEAVIMLAIDKDRAARPQTAGEMLRMLEAAAQGVAPPMRAVSSGRRSEPGAPTLAADDLELDLPAAPRPPIASTMPPPAEPSQSGGPGFGFAPAEGEHSAATAPAPVELDLDLDETALRPPNPGQSGRWQSSGIPAEFAETVSRRAPSPRAALLAAASATSAAPPPPRQGTHPYVWYGIGVVVFTVAAIFGLRALVGKPGHDPDGPPMTEGPTAVVGEPTKVAGPSTEVQIDVIGLPPGAELKLNGLPARTRPVTVRRGSFHTLEISAPGYETRFIRFTADNNKRFRANLRPLIGSGGGP